MFTRPVLKVPSVRLQTVALLSWARDAGCTNPGGTAAAGSHMALPEKAGTGTGTGTDASAVYAPFLVSVCRAMDALKSACPQRLHWIESRHSRRDFRQEEQTALVMRLRERYAGALKKRHDAPTSRRARVSARAAECKKIYDQEPGQPAYCDEFSYLAYANLVQAGVPPERLLMLHASGENRAGKPVGHALVLYCPRGFPACFMEMKDLSRHLGGQLDGCALVNAWSLDQPVRVFSQDEQMSDVTAYLRQAMREVDPFFSDDSLELEEA